MEESERNKNLLTTGNYRKKLLRFAVPVFVGNLFNQVYSIVDSLIVGNHLGATALAAVSSTASLVAFLVGIFNGFNNGMLVVIAHCFGAGEDEQSEKALHTAVGLGLVFGLALTLIGTLLGPVFLRWMGTPEEVLGLSKLYIRIYFAGGFFLVLYACFVGVLHASGDSRFPLICLITCSVLNVLLDFLFIKCFDWGVAGAAGATVLCQGCGMCMAGRRLRKGTSGVTLDLKKISLDRGLLHEMTQYGLPSAMQICVINFANVFIQSYINSFGAKAMAGVGAYGKVSGLCFLPVSAFTVAVTTFVSQNVGAHEVKRAREGAKFSLLLSSLVIESMGVLLWCFAPHFVAAFTEDPEVIFYGVQQSRICALFVVGMSFSHVASAIMRGVGRPMVPFKVMFYGWCCVRVAALLTLGRAWHDIRLAHWLYPLTWTISSVCYIFYLRDVFRNELSAD